MNWANFRMALKMLILTPTCADVQLQCVQVTVLSSADKLDAFLGQYGGGDGKSKKAGRSGAAWGGCVLLFSDKKQTSPLYRSLAAQYAGKLAFGEVCDALCHIVQMLPQSGCLAWPMKVSYRGRENSGALCAIAQER